MASRNVGVNIDEDFLSGRLSSVNINKDETIEIKRTLIGSYNWGKDKNIYIPGFPNLLRRDYLQVKIGILKQGESPVELGHSNEHKHSVYFEPVQEVLSHIGKDLNDYSIVSDRNNLRKIDAALKGEADYINFDIFLQKIKNSLIVKREDIGPPGTVAGLDFETKLCEHSDFEYCHVLVECDVNIGDKTKSKILIRGEVDASAPSASTKTLKDYKIDKTTSTGLTVHKTRGDGPNFVTLREIKMARELKDSHHFQSWILGVPYIVHGINRRFETATKENENFKNRFADVISTLLEYSEKMEEGKIYKLERRNGGPIQFLESSHPKQWLNLNEQK